MQIKLTQKPILKEKSISCSSPKLTPSPIILSRRAPTLSIEKLLGQ